MKYWKRTSVTGIRYASLWHELADFARIAVMAISAAMLLCTFLVPLSFSGYLIFAAQFFLIAAICLRRVRRVLRLGIFLAVLCVLLLVLQKRDRDLGEGSLAALTTIPASEKSRLANRIIREEDGIYLAIKLLSFLGGVSRGEQEGLQDAMQRGYALMRSSYGDFPTPLGATYLGFQDPHLFDVLQFAQTPAGESDKALVFLHGFGGNWSLLCWIVAEAAAAAGTSTFCPSTGPVGDWGSEQGAKILSTTLDTLGRKGFRTVYLAGLSAGAVGAVSLAQGHKDRFRGLILISGMGPGTAATGLDTLLITGTQDERFSPAIVKWVLRKEPRPNPHLEHHWIESDHMALLKKKSEIQEILRGWLERSRG